MRVFFRDFGVSTVLKSSRILYTLRLLALIAMDDKYAGFAGAKACHEKIRINRGTLKIT